MSWDLYLLTPRHMLCASVHLTAYTMRRFYTSTNTCFLVSTLCCEHASLTLCMAIIRF